MITEKFVDHVGSLAEFLHIGRILIRKKRGQAISILDRTPTHNTEGCPWLNNTSCYTKQSPNVSDLTQSTLIIHLHPNLMWWGQEWGENKGFSSSQSCRAPDSFQLLTLSPSMCGSQDYCRRDD